MNLTLFVVVLITAILLVVIAMSIARAISPRTFNKQKGEAYECGVPTRGKSWMQFKAGYYLFAILFLMFDVETVFLYPWAVTVQDWNKRSKSAAANWMCCSPRSIPISFTTPWTVWCG